MLTQLFRSVSLVLLSCSVTPTTAAGERIITLTPHATEMVFAAGAGAQIIGTVQASDFPPPANAIARVGDGLNTSAEQVLALQPDWVIGWQSPLMSQLESLGVQTLQSNPASLKEIGEQVLSLGQTFGTQAQAQAWYTKFAEQLQAFDNLAAEAAEAAGANSRPVNVVVLASSDARFVIGQHALINDTLARCGATNPFAQTQAPAPQISPESLIAVKPDVIISGRPLDDPQSMTLAVPLTVINADWLYRPGPRFIDAALQICQLVQQVRSKRLKQ